MSTSTNRVIQFDVLRIIAAFAVVFLHSAAQRFYNCYPSIEWDVRNVYDSLVRWAVPIFVMISGALFLNSKKKIQIKDLYIKYITRIILIFVFWSIIYGIYDGHGEKGFVSLLKIIIQGPYHFWFLKMLIGLYIVIPILRAIVADKKLEIYFICISLATAYIIPMLFPLIGYFSKTAENFATNYYEAFGIKIAVGFVGYFVLGHYLAMNALNKRARKVIYMLGVLSVIAVSLITYVLSYIYGSPFTFFYKEMSVFTLLEAVALFVLIRNMKIESKYYPILINASKLSLGIYIIHPLVMTILFDLWHIDSASFNPIFFIPIFAIFVFAISYCVVFVLIRIPIIKKFLM